MSITFRFYAIAPETVHGLWACRDEALLEKVLAAHPRHVERDGGQAIAQIIIGGDAAQPHRLGSAVEAICHEAGEYLGDFYDNDVHRVQELLRDAGVDRSLLYDTVSERWPFPIPETHEGPFVGLFTNDELAATLDDLKRLSPCGDEMKDQALEFALQVYGDAVAGGKGAIVFNS